MIPELVYILCGATSTLCAYLLFRSYSLSRHRLMLWSGWGFLGLALNNIILLVDVQIGPVADLAIYRTLPALIGMMVLTWGLISETSN